MKDISEELKELTNSNNRYTKLVPLIDWNNEGFFDDLSDKVNSATVTKNLEGEIGIATYDDCDIEFDNSDNTLTPYENDLGLRSNGEVKIQVGDYPLDDTPAIFNGIVEDISPNYDNSEVVITLKDELRKLDEVNCRDYFYTDTLTDVLIGNDEGTPGLLTDISGLIDKSEIDSRTDIDTITEVDSDKEVRIIYSFVDMTVFEAIQMIAEAFWCNIYMDEGVFVLDKQFEVDEETKVDDLIANKEIALELTDSENFSIREDYTTQHLHNQININSEYYKIQDTTTVHTGFDKYAYVDDEVYTVGESLDIDKLELEIAWKGDVEDKRPDRVPIRDGTIEIEYKNPSTGEVEFVFVDDLDKGETRIEDGEKQLGIDYKFDESYYDYENDSSEYEEIPRVEFAEKYEFEDESDILIADDGELMLTASYELKVHYEYEFITILNGLEREFTLEFDTPVMDVEDFTEALNFVDYHSKKHSSAEIKFEDIVYIGQEEATFAGYSVGTPQTNQYDYEISVYASDFEEEILNEYSDIIPESVSEGDLTITPSRFGIKFETTEFPEQNIFKSSNEPSPGEFKYGYSGSSGYNYRISWDTGDLDSLNYETLTLESYYGIDGGSVIERSDRDYRGNKYAFRNENESIKMKLEFGGIHPQEEKDVTIDYKVKLEGKVRFSQEENELNDIVSIEKKLADDYNSMTVTIKNEYQPSEEFVIDNEYRLSPGAISFYNGKIGDLDNPQIRFKGKPLINDNINITEDNSNPIDGDKSSKDKYGTKDFDIQNNLINNSQYAKLITSYLLHHFNEPKSELRVTTKGRFDIELNDLVKINQQEKSFDGVYRVTGVTDNIDEDKWDTELTLLEINTEGIDADLDVDDEEDTDTDDEPTRPKPIRVLNHNVRRTTGDNIKVDLSWNEVSNAKQYNIYRKEAIDTQYRHIETVRSGTTSYTDSGVDFRGNYNYVVRSENEDEIESDVSKTDEINVYAYAEVSSEGTEFSNIRCRYNGDTVILAWKSVSDVRYEVRLGDVIGEGYVVYRGSETKTEVENVNMRELTFHIRTFTDNSNYSEEVDVITVKKEKPPALNFNEVRSTFNNEIKLFWFNESDAIEYEIRTDTNFGADDDGRVYKGKSLNCSFNEVDSRTHTFYGKCIDELGYSDEHGEVELVNYKPAAPDLQVDNITEFFESISITIPTVNEDVNGNSKSDVQGYKVYVKNTETEEINIIPSATAQRITYNSKSGKEFEVRVLAYDNLGDGDKSNPVYVETKSIDNVAQFAQDLKPPKLVDGLPNLPDDEYPEGKLVVDKTTKTLYKNIDNEWKSDFDMDDLTVYQNLVASTVIAGAVGAREIKADEIFATDTIGSREFIGDEANFRDAVITSAKIKSVETDKLTVGGEIADRVLPKPPNSTLFHFDRSLNSTDGQKPVEQEDVTLVDDGKFDGGVEVKGELVYELPSEEVVVNLYRKGDKVKVEDDLSEGELDNLVWEG